VAKTPNTGRSATADSELLSAAQRQARVYEALVRSQGPGRSTRRQELCAVLVEARHATPARLLGAVIDFMRPSLAHSGQPRELWAHTVSLGEVHVAFLGSEPDFREDGEYLLEPLGLPRYFLVEHDHRRRFDRFLEGGDAGIAICSPDVNDFETEVPDPFRAGLRVDQTGPWQLLQRRTGVGLSALRGAIAKARPVWLICRGLVVAADP
jgi:hypothetical protein